MSGRPLRETATEIGVASGTLARWVRQAEIDEGKAAGLTTEEREELRRLRRENRLLKEEKEILRKATVFLTRFKTKDEARLAIFRYIEGFYNPLRRHSALGHKSPAEYERMLEETSAQAVVSS